MVLCGFRRDVRRISDNLLSVLLLSKFRIYCHSYSDSPDSPFRSLQLQAVPPSHGILLESSLGSRKGNWELAEAVLAPSLAAVLCACLIHHPSPRCSQLCYLHLHKASSGGRAPTKWSFSCWVPDFNTTGPAWGRFGWR